MGRNRTWHPEAIYRCRTEHGNMRPTAQDERRGDGSGERSLLWRATIVIVLAPCDEVNSVKDGSLILGNMMLAAHSIGLASCWINREDAMFASEEGKKLMKEWNLPEGLIGIGALALGYASAHPHTVKPRKEDYYRIIK